MSILSGFSNHTRCSREYAKCLRDLIRIRTNPKTDKDDLSSLRLRAQKIFYPNLSAWIMDKIDAEG